MSQCTPRWIEMVDNAKLWMQSSPNATLQEYDGRLRVMYESYDRILLCVDPSKVLEYPWLELNDC